MTYRLRDFNIWQGPPEGAQPRVWQVTVELPAGAAAPTDAVHLGHLAQAWPTHEVVSITELDYPQPDPEPERAGPWKSGYGEYPMADEIYDLTHEREPDEGLDPYDDWHYRGGDDD